jgi:hypothetical protein
MTEREKFEAWAKQQQPGTLDLTPFDDTYDSDFTSRAWDAWQARVALESRVLAERKPVAWLVDPGVGSAMDKFQRTAPSEFQLEDIKRRGGSVTPLYTMDQMRDYAESFHRSRIEAGFSEIKGMSKKIPGDFLGNPANNPTLARKLGYNDALKDVLAVLSKKPTEGA